MPVGTHSIGVALGFSRAKGYDLVRRGEFPCRGVLRIGRITRVRGNDAATDSRRSVAVSQSGRPHLPNGGTPGKTGNCQIRVFASYATSSGRVLVDRRLYLAKAGTPDRDCRRADVPADQIAGRDLAHRPVH